MDTYVFIMLQDVVISYGCLSSLLGRVLAQTGLSSLGPQPTATYPLTGAVQAKMNLITVLLGLATLSLVQSRNTPVLDCKYGQLPGRWVNAAGRSDGKEVRAICVWTHVSAFSQRMCCS